ncbi:MAG: DsbA family protein [Pseudomonadota bacterium]
MATSRRGLLVGAAGLTAVAWVWQRFGVQPVNMAFEPIADLAGWQRAVVGGVSGGNATNAVFAGLDDDHVPPLPVAEICQNLYRVEGNGPRIAVFTDFFCPNCRVMDPILAARMDISVTWHELPLQSEHSENVARALLAADLQGGYHKLKARLLGRGFAPGSHRMGQAAEAAGLDAEAVLADAAGADVTARLETSKALASTLGIWGTPALTLGQTLVMGRQSRDQIDHLIATVSGSCA